MKNSFTSDVIVTVMFFAIIGIIAMASFSGMRASTESARYVHILESQGYKHIALDTSWVWFGCSDDDVPWASRSFSALGSNNQSVTGFVCCGWLTKACTVRVAY